MAQPEEITIQKSVLIKHSHKNLYRLLHNFGNFPLILDFLENVLIIDNARSRWTAKIGEEGEQVIWDVEITREVEFDFFEWHSSANTDILHEGRFQFSNSNLHPGTILNLQLRFYFPPLNDSRAVLIDDSFGDRIQDNLLRFKQAIEANEFPYPHENKNNIPEGFSTEDGQWRNFL